MQTREKSKPILIENHSCSPEHDDRTKRAKSRLCRQIKRIAVDRSEKQVKLARRCEELIAMLRNFSNTAGRVLKLFNESSRESDATLKIFSSQRIAISEFMDDLEKHIMVVRADDVDLSKENQQLKIEVDKLSKALRKEQKDFQLKDEREKVYQDLRREELEVLKRFVRQRMESQCLEFSKLLELTERQYHLKVILSQQVGRQKEVQLKEIIRLVKGEYEQHILNRPYSQRCAMLSETSKQASEEKAIIYKIKDLLKYLKAEYTEAKPNNILYLLEMLEVRLFNLKIEMIPTIKRQNETYVREIKQLTAELEAQTEDNRRLMSSKANLVHLEEEVKMLRDELFKIEQVKEPQYFTTTMSQQIRSLEKSRAELQRQIVDIENQKSELQKQKTSLQAIVNKVIEQLQTICVSSNLLRREDLKDMKLNGLLDVLHKCLFQDSKKINKVNRIAELQKEYASLYKSLTKWQEDFEVVLSQKVYLQEHLQRTKAGYIQEIDTLREEMGLMTRSRDKLKNSEEQLKNIIGELTNVERRDTEMQTMGDQSEATAQTQLCCSDEETQTTDEKNGIGIQTDMDLQAISRLYEDIDMLRQTIQQQTVELTYRMQFSQESEVKHRLSEVQIQSLKMQLVQIKFELEATENELKTSKDKCSEKEMELNHQRQQFRLLKDNTSSTTELFNELQSQIQTKNEKIDQLKGQIAHLADINHNLTTNHATLINTSCDLSNANAHLTNQISCLQHQTEQLSQQNEQLRAEITKLQDHINNMQCQMHQIQSQNSLQIQQTLSEFSQSVITMMEEQHIMKLQHRVSQFDTKVSGAERHLQGLTRRHSVREMEHNLTKNMLQEYVGSCQRLQIEINRLLEQLQNMKERSSNSRRLEEAMRTSQKLKEENEQLRDMLVSQPDRKNMQSTMKQSGYETPEKIELIQSQMINTSQIVEFVNAQAQTELCAENVEVQVNTNGKTQIQKLKKQISTILQEEWKYMENKIATQLKPLMDKSLELVKTIGRKFRFSFVPQFSIIDQTIKLINQLQVDRKDTPSPYYDVLQKLVEELLNNRVNLNLQQQIKTLQPAEKQKILGYRQKIADLQNQLTKKDELAEQLHLLQGQAEQLRTDIKAKDKRMAYYQDELNEKDTIIADLKKKPDPILSEHSLQSLFLNEQQLLQVKELNVSSQGLPQLLDQSGICSDEIAFTKSELTKCLKDNNSLKDKLKTARHHMKRIVDLIEGHSGGAETNVKIYQAVLSCRNTLS